MRAARCCRCWCGGVRRSRRYSTKRKGADMQITFTDPSLLMGRPPVHVRRVKLEVVMFQPPASWVAKALAVNRTIHGLAELSVDNLHGPALVGGRCQMRGFELRQHDDGGDVLRF